MSTAFRNRIIELISQNSPMASAQGTIVSYNTLRKTAMIDYTLYDGSRYENVEAEVPFINGFSLSRPKKNEVYTIGFNNGNPNHPYLIARVEVDEIILPEIDHLSYEFQEID